MLLKDVAGVQHDDAHLHPARLERQTMLISGYPGACTASLVRLTSFFSTLQTLHAPRHFLLGGISFSKNDTVFASQYKMP